MKNKFFRKMIEVTESQEKIFEIGRVYRLYSDEYNYIGSTNKTLKQRLSQHECHYKMFLAGHYHECDSFLIIETGKYQIELLAEFQNIPERNLRKIEQECIDKTDCINEKHSYRKIINGNYYCEFCKKNIDASGGHIVQHEKRKKHQQNSYNQQMIEWNKKFPHKKIKTKLSIIKKKIKINLTKKFSP